MAVVMNYRLDGTSLSPSAPASQVVVEVRNKLQSSSHRFQDHVFCEFDGGVLRMTGRLPSFYLKQLAQSLAERVAGIEHIDNRIDVMNPVGRSSVREV